MTARERLVKLLRREAADVRQNFPEWNAHQRAVAEMRGFADLCDEVAKEQAAIISAAASAQATDGGGA